MARIQIDFQRRVIYTLTANTSILNGIQDDMPAYVYRGVHYWTSAGTVPG